MPIFLCEECGCVENTACSLFWVYWGKDRRKLCSACDPRIRKWHGKFKKHLPSEAERKDVERFLKTIEPTKEQIEDHKRVVKQLAKEKGDSDV